MASFDDDANLGDLAPIGSGNDAAVEIFLEWCDAQGTKLYPAQEEALLEVASGSHVIVNTPTGSGKSLVAVAAHLVAMCAGERTYYTAPIKALVSEKFFDLSRIFGAEKVGLVTGDGSVNPNAPIICCTAEIVANQALRFGRKAEIGQVVADEFHYIADPDRGWAWQVPLLELLDTQHVLMSATLGDVSRFVAHLEANTSRPCAVVTSSERPVPLVHEFSMTPATESLEMLVESNAAPIYIVHPTQVGAVERAQSLMSNKFASRAEKDRIAAAVGDFRFTSGFGKSLSRYVRNGIGVHHAGMLPRYRRLVERLAQDGLLKVICGTDTLGVGINVPIRTVVMTSLSKFDGSTTRLLSAREFHQISGRAGRAGFDTSGNVVVMAPEHVIENAKAEAKAASDPKRLRKLVKRKPPEGMVSWGRPTFERLVAAQPERLDAPLAVSNSMVLNVLDRQGDGRAQLQSLINSSFDSPEANAAHLARAQEIEATLIDAGVVEELSEPDEEGRTVRVIVELQPNFALDQPLGPFALAALDLLDEASAEHHLDVISVIESVLEDPRPIIRSQRDKARSEAITQMKADGLDYEQRMAELDSVTHPQPLADVLVPMFRVYRDAHPWVGDFAIRPKSVVRQMLELAMNFNEFVSFHSLQRSEGVVLRYLSDAYKALTRTVPEDRKSDELREVTAWLGQIVRQTDSSLLNEWTSLRSGDLEVDPAMMEPAVETVLTNDVRAFTLMIRNAMFRRVELLSARRWADLAEAETNGWNTTRWRESGEAYFAEFDSIAIDGDARSNAMVHIVQDSDVWTAEQTLADPAGEHEWRLRAEIPVEASNENGYACVRTVSLSHFNV